MSRVTPFDLVFSRIAAERFPPLRAALAAASCEPRDRDAFLMVREAIQIVRELRPDEGVGEAIDQLVALVHHAYLFWAAGTPVLELEQPALAELLASSSDDGDAGDVPPAYYAQLAELRVWAEVVEKHPFEPLDGCFVHAAPGGELRVLGVFGIQPERQGFSVVEAIGRRPPALVREDGKPLFAPMLEGGSSAGLYSIAGEEELLELGWRTRAAAPRMPAA